MDFFERLTVLGLFGGIPLVFIGTMIRDIADCNTDPWRTARLLQRIGTAAIIVASLSFLFL